MKPKSGDITNNDNSYQKRKVLYKFQLYIKSPANTIIYKALVKLLLSLIDYTEPAWKMRYVSQSRGVNKFNIIVLDNCCRLA